MRHTTRKLLIIFLIIILLILGFLVMQARPKEPINVTGQIEESVVTTNLQVHFIDVGQGDCTLIICNGQTLLIDAGNNDKGTAVQHYLQKQGITQLDYVIATHPDADHIGGMDVILTKFDCKQIFMPDVSNDTATYRDMVDAMEYKGYRAVFPEVGSVYKLGVTGDGGQSLQASFTIIAPSGSYEDNNNASIGIHLTHGENSFVFTGDAKAEAEADILKNGMVLSADVLKIAHHGSNGSTTEAFLEAVAPTYAVISCGKDNDYGHPAAGTLNRLREADVKVFRTDEQGTIVAISDGSSITFNYVPSESWKAGVIVAPDSQDAPLTPEEIAEAYIYVINTRTGKFHKANCESVADMYEKNRFPSNLTREEIVEEGYVPCKACKP